MTEDKNSADEVLNRSVEDLFPGKTGSEKLAVTPDLTTLIACELKCKARNLRFHADQMVDQADDIEKLSDDMMAYKQNKREGTC